MYNATRPQLSNLPALEFYENVYPALPPADRPLECVQQAGDIMYGTAPCTPYGPYDSSFGPPNIISDDFGARFHYYLPPRRGHVIILDLACPGWSYAEWCSQSAGVTLL